MFAPNVEPNAGQEMFLSDDPMELLMYGELADVPVMMGSTRDDGSFLVPGTKCVLSTTLLWKNRMQQLKII